MDVRPERPAAVQVEPCDSLHFGLFGGVINSVLGVLVVLVVVVMKSRLIDGC